jgi:cysteinyl-tRNA synthetase
MDALNVKRPSIEPRASGHIIEQIQLIQKILDTGFAYVVNGSVYFDVIKYHEKYQYGKLSGRVIEDLFSSTRELEGQHEKRNSVDFALWKKAQPEHIMRWPSPWSDGFPGWHLECSTMGIKYLGEQFDIHGGGMDLLFPHHESEIAQSRIANGKDAVKYWLHNNMVTINGQKMGKSLNNFITLDEFFSGKHAALSQAYSPMTIRFFILQAHYRSTLDFSNEALQAAEKGLKKLMAGIETLNKLLTHESAFGSQQSAVSNQQSTVGTNPPSSILHHLYNSCYDALNDDFNSPIVIANLFEGVRIINSVNDGKESLSIDDMSMLKALFNTFVFDILGLKEEKSAGHHEFTEGLMQLIIELRQKARINKDWGTSDQIRDALLKLGISVKDTKDGSTWSAG